MADASALPVPPPWTAVACEGEGGEPIVKYVHDVSKEEIFEHPLVRLQRRQESRQKLEVGAGAADESLERTTEGTDRLPIPEVDAGEDAGDEPGEFSDFNCKWKESSIGEKDRYYTLILRYYNESGRAAVKFVGLSGAWKYSLLQGPYGPITRYDLFIGAQITLFGRHLTIRATSANVCHWIDEEAALLEKQRLWLQDKISSTGIVPVVRKEPHKQLHHVERLTSTTGTKNLRKIHIQICKLREQLCDLGLEHFADMMPKQKTNKKSH